MRISIQIRIDHEDGQSIITKPVAEFRRESLVTNTLGLTLTESKSILQNVQSELAQQHQVDVGVRPGSSRKIARLDHEVTARY